MTDPFTTRRVDRVGPAGSEPFDDRVAAEAPLEIRISDTPIAVLMRTPGNDEELVNGLAQYVSMEPGERLRLLELSSPLERAEALIDLARE